MSEKAKKQLKIFLIALVAFIAALGIVLACCYTLIKTNMYKIAIGEHLDDWDEEKFVSEMAADKEGGIYLARDGVSDFKILLRPEYAESLEADAIYMQSVLRQMVSGKSIDEVGDADGFEIISEASSSPMIVLNDVPTSGEQADKLLEEVKDDGYRLMYGGGNIYICGQKRTTVYEELGKEVSNDGTSGTANGIYCFLENDLGCMFVREEAKYDYIPKMRTICLPADGGRVDNPDFAWRRIYQYEVNDFVSKEVPVTKLNWSRRIKSNGTGDYIFTDKGSGLNDGNAQWGTWCHSVYTFVPPEKYFDTHPEYYSLIAGKRRTEYNGLPGQLCLSNPDIVDIIDNGMSELMEQYPDAIYWDFSINDSRMHCECSQCTAKFLKYGSHAGVMLEIINEIASRHPDKRICTLAYFYTKVVPRNITLRDNVSITIAPLSSSQLHSSKYGFMNSAQAKKMVEGWSKISKHIAIWDYTVNFRHLLCPFPNYAVQQENLKFYKENGVDMVFHQGSREKNDEQARLRSYLLARQLWDIDVDVNKLTGKYLKVTYKEAAPKIAEYLDIMHNEAEKAWEMDIYDEITYHERDYLSKKNLRKYSQLLSEAYELAQDDATRFFVEEFQVNVDYALMMADSTTFAEKEQAFERFKALTAKHDILRVNEVGAEYEMSAFINYTYPEKLAQKRTSLIGLCVGLAFSVALAACAIVAIKLFRGAYLRRKRGA